MHRLVLATSSRLLLDKILEFVLSSLCILHLEFSALEIVANHASLTSKLFL